ncbi:MAG: phage/plasmid primase, P4 family [Mucispirillum schaedleri]|nr:phage/plasmid primase, P4 family [Mucispirillum schaedleri]
MNKAFFERYVSSEPTNAKEKYIFIVDNEEIAQSIILVGFKSVFLANEDSEYQYSVDTFLNYLDETICKKKNRRSYTYISACLTKRANDTLEEYFKAEYLKTHQGWQLFKNKEYLANYDRENELKKVLEEFIKRFEGDNDLHPDLMKFHFYNDNGKITGINHNAIVEDIKEKHSLFVSGCFYESDRGYYKPDATGARIKDYIKQRIDPDMRKSQVINQVYNLLHDDFSIERNFRDTNLYPVRWVPFNDCLLDPLTWEEMEYKNEFYCVNRLPHNWKDCKNAVDGEEIEKYLRFAIPDKQDREMALAYDGLSCNRDTSFQKAMLYVGQGGSGKSIKLRISQAVLGAENYSNVGLFDLGKRFMPGLLLGKLANICSDLPIKALSDEANEALKLIVGEDMIFYETKGQNGFFFTPYCKMTFSTNMLPQVLDERNNAVFRRLLILRMDNTPEHPDVNLFSKLEKELPYYIKLIMEALHRLYERGYILESENSKKEIEQMRRDSDTTEDFLDMCCTKKVGARVDRSELFIRYEKHCEDEGRQSLSKNAFNKAIRAKGFKQIKSCGYWYFEGISLEKSSLDSPSTDKQCSLNGVEVDENGFIKVDEEVLKDLPFT